MGRHYEDRVGEGDDMSQVLSRRPPQHRDIRYSIQDRLRFLKRDIRKMFAADARRERVMRPLRAFLVPVHRRMDREGVPLDERTITLGKKRWPRIYKAGINRYWGIDIEWVDGNV